MVTRRAFLRTTGAASAASLAAFTDHALARVGYAAAGAGTRAPGDLAMDETYWREIQQAFTLDRTIINLNNGGCCPSPRVVHETFKRYLDLSNQAPVYHMWQILEPNVESVRRRLAAAFGCSPDELAITRNASEALQIAQLGLDLKAGDEVVTTNQDYGRMLDTWDQRVRRDGIVVKKVSFPVPPPSLDVLADRLLSAITPATRVLHFCHITNLTGQIFPVRAICDEARRRGIQTIVDGAHAFAQFPFTPGDARLRLLRHQPAQVAAGADRHRLPVRPARTHRLAVAADPGQRHAQERHPEVRGDRYPSGGKPQCDRRGPDLSRGNRGRAQGRAPALPARPLGDPAQVAGPDPDPHQPGPRAVMRDRHGADYRRPAGQAGRATVGEVADHRDADRARGV